MAVVSENYCTAGVAVEIVQEESTIAESPYALTLAWD
jgi:hypothetical protein